MNELRDLLYDHVVGPLIFAENTLRELLSRHVRIGAFPQIENAENENSNRMGAPCRTSVVNFDMFRMSFLIR